MVESLFAGVAEGRVADVVGQRQRLGQFRVQSQGGGQGAGDLGHFQGVGEAAAEVVAGRIAGQAGKDLGLAGQAAKGARVQDAGGVAGKGGAIGVRRLGDARGGSVRRPARRGRRSPGAVQRPVWFPISSSMTQIWSFTSGYTADRDVSVQEMHMRAVNHHRLMQSEVL